MGRSSRRVWEAEREHQDYLLRNPGGYTCHFVRPGWTHALATDVSKQDRAIAPDLERFFAKRMKEELDTSHVAMLSKPNDVAAVIMDAAAKAPH